MTGACGTWNRRPGLRKDPELGQGGSRDGAEALGSGLDKAFLSSLCVPGTESIPFRSFCGAIITPILQTGQRSPEQLADLPRALQLTKWQSQGPNSGQCDSEALMSYPLHHLPDRSWLPPRLPFSLVSGGVERGEGGRGEIGYPLLPPVPELGSLPPPRSRLRCCCHFSSFSFSCCCCCRP